MTPPAPGPAADSLASPHPELVELAASARRVTVLTGAGMSAESGVPTFRDALTGLWANHDPQVLTSIGAWRRDPDLVWAWHLWLGGLMRAARPNPGHEALARWAAEDADVQVRIVTQNIDDLHERAGSDVISYLHGSIASFRCAACSHPHDGPDDYPDEPVGRAAPPRCDRCGDPVRPGVVWFGEVLPADAVEAAVAAMEDADLVLVVGTSGIVQPAASLPGIALDQGTPVVEINPAPTRLSGLMDHAWRAGAGTALPALVDGILAAR